MSWGFSQSGQSPDLVAPTRYFRDGGARTVAVVNDAGSPLAEAAQWVLPLHAGAETSVAATKSYIAQLVAGARIVAHWQNDTPLLAALETLPEVLERAAYADWSPLVDALVDADKLFVIGRGTSLAIAMEAALKFKEVCGIQAEAFSRRRGQARPDGADRGRLSAAGVRAARPGPGRPAAAGRRDAPPRRARAGRGARWARRAPSCRWWPPATRTSTRSRRSRATTWPSRRSRARRGSIRTSRAT